MTKSVCRICKAMGGHGDHEGRDPTKDPARETKIHKALAAFLCQYHTEKLKASSEKPWFPKWIRKRRAMLEFYRGDDTQWWREWYRYELDLGTSYGLHGKKLLRAGLKATAKDKA